MISDEEWKRGPDWSKWTPRTILKKKCDCERKIVAYGYDGSITRQKRKINALFNYCRLAY